MSAPPDARTCHSRVRVRYAETDQMGVVYHANYFAWFEIGRTDWLRHAGWSYRDMEREGGVHLPVVEAHCEYKQPAKYDDEIDIAATPTLLSAVRVRFDYTLTRAADRTVLATGHTVHAAVDVAEGRVCRLPERVRASLA
jgi:acyl-CoA thioester hydrolase